MSAGAATSAELLRLMRQMNGKSLQLCTKNAAQLALKEKATKKHLCFITAHQIKHMASRGLIKRKGSDIRLTQEAMQHLKRASDVDEMAFANQHRTIRQITLGAGRDAYDAAQNIDESPLTALYRRKTKNGASFLTEAEFLAGERLRRDATFGALMPSITMRWQAKLSGASGTDQSDFSDQTMGARQRVHHALAAVGPELGSILIDVCCFLKGMEAIERERGWPVRSAKVVLKTALGALDRHYNPKGQNRPHQFNLLDALTV